MALYAVCSAKGSPGVTTVATALALAWEGPVVLADLDPAGGDLGVRYRDAEGRPLLVDRGLVSLGASVRRGTEAGALDAHLQMTTGGLPVLAGVARPEQVVGLGGSWPHIAYALGSAPGGDVVADCGRILPGSAVLPVLAGSQAVLFLVRPVVEELFHLRERLTGLAEQMGGREAAGVPIGVAVLTDERDRSSAGEVQQMLTSARIRATVVGQVATDPKAAVRLRYDLGSLSGRSLLRRSASAVGESVRELAAERLRQMA